MAMLNHVALPPKRPSARPALSHARLWQLGRRSGRNALGALLALLTSGCQLALSGQPCPCASGFRCCASTQRCVEVQEICPSVGQDAGPNDALPREFGSADNRSTVPIRLAGVAYKGPLALGSSIIVSQLNLRGEVVGDPVMTQTLDDVGSYQLDLSHRGPIAVTASGFSYREDGATPEDITIKAVGVINDQAAQGLHLNVITHLTYERIRRLMRSGTTAQEAIAQAERELHASLGLLPAGADVRGAARTRVLGEDDDTAAYTLLLSAVLIDTAEGAPVQQLLDRIQADLSADGQLEATLVSGVVAAHRALAADEVTRNLRQWLDSNALSTAVPNLHRVLDYDNDGIVNAEDNCRYAANADQSHRPCLAPVSRMVLSAPGRSAEACVLMSDGTGIRCVKRVQSRGSLATLLAPANTVALLPGTYSDLATDGEELCALRQNDGTLACYRLGPLGAQAMGYAVPSGAFVDVALAGNFCALAASGVVSCFNSAGIRSFAPRTGQHPTTLVDYGSRVDRIGYWCAAFNDGGRTRCFHPTVHEEQGPKPPIAYDNLQLSDTSRGAYGCALRAGTASISCFGHTPATPPAGDFVQVALHSENACAIRDDGRLLCWSGPAAPTDLRFERIWVGAAAVCAVDTTGAWHCW